jgi:hypothetical protein
LNIVIAVGTEGRDEEGRVVVKGIVVGDGEKEVALNVFVLGAPDFLTTFVDDGVLVWVVSDSSSVRQGGKEVGEELGFRGDREWEVGENGSRWGRGGDDSDGCFSDRWWEVFDEDVGERDMLDDFFELKVDVGILVFRGRGILKLRAYYVSLFGGNIGEDVEEVGQGSDKGQRQGAIGIEARGRAITSWTGVISGVVRTVKVVLDDLVGSGDVDLVGVVDLRPVGNREGRGDDKGG